MTAIAGEMRRLSLYGLTDEEYQAGVKALNAQVEAEVGQAPTMTGSQLAESIVSNLTQNGTFSTAEEDQRIGRLALKVLTRDKVNAEFARVWTRAGQPEIVLIEPTAQPDAAVLAAWRHGRGRPAARRARRPCRPHLGLHQLRPARPGDEPRRRCPTSTRRSIAVRQRRAAELQGEPERPGPGGNPHPLRRRPGGARSEGPAGRPARRLAAARRRARQERLRGHRAALRGARLRVPVLDRSATPSRSAAPRARPTSTSSCS